MSKSRIADLIEMKLGQPLVPYIRSLRQNGASWHSCVVDLATTTQVEVTPETLRIWMSDEPDMERGTKVGAA